MFVVALHFTSNRTQAVNFIQGHKDWIRQGFDDGVFLLVGSLQSRTVPAGAAAEAAVQHDNAPPSGGMLLAHATSRDQLRRRIERDPFVAEGIVNAEIFEVAPSRVDSRLQFLGDPQPTTSSS